MANETDDLFFSFYLSFFLLLLCFLHRGCLSPHSVMNRGKLEDLVAEHYDNLYYLNDIFLLNVHPINEVLEAQILKKFVVPLYIHSLVPEKNDFEVGLALLSFSLYLLCSFFFVPFHGVQWLRIPRHCRAQG